MTYFRCSGVCPGADESQSDTHTSSLTSSVNIDVNIRHYQLHSDLTLCKHKDVVLFYATIGRQRQSPPCCTASSILLLSRDHQRWAEPIMVTWQEQNRKCRKSRECMVSFHTEHLISLQATEHWVLVSKKEQRIFGERNIFIACTSNVNLSRFFS